MLRQQVLKQYKSFLKIARRLPDQSQSAEVIAWVRADFKRHSSVPNGEEDRIKGLLHQGERMLKELKQNVDLTEA